MNRVPRLREPVVSLTPWLAIGGVTLLLLAHLSTVHSDVINNDICHQIVHTKKVLNLNIFAVFQHEDYLYLITGDFKVYKMSSSMLQFNQFDFSQVDQTALDQQWPELNAYMDTIQNHPTFLYLTITRNDLKRTGYTNNINFIMADTSVVYFIKSNWTVQVYPAATRVAMNLTKDPYQPIFTTSSSEYSHLSYTCSDDYCCDKMIKWGYECKIEGTRVMFSMVQALNIFSTRVWSSRPLLLYTVRDQMGSAKRLVITQKWDLDNQAYPDVAACPGCTYSAWQAISDEDKPKPGFISEPNNRTNQTWLYMFGQRVVYVVPYNPRVQLYPYSPKHLIHPFLDEVVYAFKGELFFVCNEDNVKTVTYPSIATGIRTAQTLNMTVQTDVIVYHDGMDPKMIAVLAGLAICLFIIVVLCTIMGIKSVRQKNNPHRHHKHHHRRHQQKSAKQRSQLEDSQGYSSNIFKQVPESNRGSVSGVGEAPPGSSQNFSSDPKNKVAGSSQTKHASSLGSVKKPMGSSTPGAGTIAPLFNQSTKKSAVDKEVKPGKRKTSSQAKDKTRKASKSSRK